MLLTVARVWLPRWLAGIAALLLEYYPKLSARQLKYILMHSVMKLPQSKVKWPGQDQWVDFNQFSVSGGIVNAYNALKLGRNHERRA